MGRSRKWRTAANSDTIQRPLSLEPAESYDCPVCRHGQIQAMALMDTFACSFCRHILEANLEQQTVHIVDGAQPMGWRWLGHNWQPIYQGRADITLMLWVVGTVLMIFPAGIVALGAYMFPPLEGTTGPNWPMLWAIGTLLVHGTMVGWLVAEYYQFPPYVMAKIRLQRWREQISN
jgi:hypothetical protein